MDENIEITNLKLANNTIIALRWEIARLKLQLDESQYENEMLRKYSDKLNEKKRFRI